MQKTTHEEINDREKKQKQTTMKMTERYHSCIRKMVEKIVYEIRSHNINQNTILRTMRVIRNMFRHIHVTDMFRWIRQKYL